MNNEIKDDLKQLEKGVSEYAKNAERIAARSELRAIRDDIYWAREEVLFGLRKEGMELSNEALRIESVDRTSERRFRAAKAAMQGMLAGGYAIGAHGVGELVKESVSAADALLEQLAARTKDVA